MKNLTDFIRYIKRNKGVFNLIHMESVPSLPVPIFSKGKVYLAFLFYTAKRGTKDKKIQIYKPNSKIIIDAEFGNIIFYRNYLTFGEFSDYEWEKPIGEFPHSEIDSLTLKEYKERRDNFIKNYEEIIKAIQNDSSNQEFKASIHDEFYALCEPCLIPFLKKIGKKFFSWLDS